MKNYIIFSLISIFMLASCQPKIAENKTKSEDQKQKQPEVDETNAVTIIQDYPNSHSFMYDESAISSDTTLLITMESVDDQFIEQSYNSSIDTMIKVKYHDFNVNLKLISNEQIVFERTIDKSLFAKTMDKEFPNIARIQSAWFDSITDKGEIIINLTICEPETDYCYFYHLLIDKKLQFRFELIEIT